MTSNRPVSEMVCPFDETVTHELEVALDNYADDPDDNDALNRLANNCVTIGYEFALRATPQPLSDDVVERVARAIEQQAANDRQQKVRDNWQGYARAAIAALQAVPADLIQQQLAEIADLKHDLDRYMKIANIECNEAEDAKATIERLSAALEVRDKVIGVFADALDIADGIIDTNLGTDTPKEWDRAFARCQKARAALGKDASDE